MSANFGKIDLNLIMYNMEKRSKLILDTIIKEHTKTGAPVGSGVLVNKYNLEVSPATVRNEMAKLEEDGYIAQPYTSAGRIPTELAYLKYIESIKEKKLNERESETIEQALVDRDEFGFKQTAKVMAEISGNAVFWAFHKHNLYYTGISNLFSQPEFSQTNLIHNISTVIDRMDEIIDDIFDDIEHEPRIMIGSKNPFGNFCSVVLVKYKYGDNTGMIGVLSPIRTDYKKNLGLVNYILNKINK